ncbi:MBL fold metallo-hydrolase [Actinosynnema pretiosum subsp. pretiosum]|uniref:Beta-lactamase domain protein n=2 Tax=Actinosynnema TaxID=40566 RepID=C6WNQ3_ACTMD|nr:MBL fold metallo-hydrolase [Actinosynnema mirum]ACU34972.1 beta-lactamase domain protein [Actinosynnema mirum DSM 43827]AXX28343.1 Ribonuclease Z [Actinosynnema pretiosum subsp. pretiosum]QUF07293.1 MBL fold metallo-hydrolase [Actinosynnema pretiosum subsp. pretiosum]
MLLTVLGCSGSLPGPESPSSGYLVESGGCAVALDLGSGVLAAMQARECDPFDLGALLLSHLHPDHCADFTTLAVMRRYHIHPPYDAYQRKLPVHGPSEVADRLARAYAESAEELATTDLSDVFDFHVLDAGSFEVGPFRVRSRPVEHSCEAHGFRLEADGAAIAYTGDSGPCAALADLASGVDLLLAEATWTDHPDRPLGEHLSGAQAGRLAHEAGVGELVLTHLAPWTDPAEVLAEARAEYSGPVTLARAGGVHEVAGPAARVVGGRGN